jgi:outer membrane protein OmpA-like peptidoglycan-associated protein
MGLHAQRSLEPLRRFLISSSLDEQKPRIGAPSGVILNWGHEPMIRRAIPLATAALTLSACANLNSVQYRYDNEHSSTVLLDAKERAINVYHNNNGDQVCSEQAPDAFAVLATSLAASGQLSEPTGKSIGLNGSFSQSESGASLAFRTQLTQTEAQILYQLCALAANGKISEVEVATELRRLQHSLVALLAVEQLTGVAKPTVVAIGAGTSGSVGDQLAAAQKQLDDANKTAASAKSALDDATKKVADDKQAVGKAQTTVNNDADAITKDKSALTAATTDDTKSKAQSQLDTDTKTQQTDQQTLTDAQSKQKNDEDDLATKQSAANDADANVKAYTANRDTLRGALSTGTAAAAPAFSLPGAGPTTSDQAIASIAMAVRDIVSMADNGYTDACLILLTQGDKNSLDMVKEMDCKAHLQRVDAYKKHYLDVYPKLVGTPAPPPEAQDKKTASIPYSPNPNLQLAGVLPLPPPPPAPSVAQKYLVFFDFDKSDLRPDGKRVVDEAGEYFKQNGKTVIHVTGHTDTAGTVEYNFDLSQRRAMAVSQELVKIGIKASEIQITGKGKSEPLVPTVDGIKEPQNRRVEIVLDG